MDDLPFDPSSPLPHKGAFFPFEGTYLNSASQHPINRMARQAYRQPLVDYLQDELPRLGYATVTPRGAGSAIVSFRHDDAAGLRKRLSAEKITITVSDHYFSMALSVFNDSNDVERLVRTLA